MDISYQEEEKEIEQSCGQKIKKLKKKLKQCQQQKREYLSGWQRSQADFANYKKKWEEKLVHWEKFSNERLILELLPFMDTLEAISLKNFQDEQIKKGLEGMKLQLLDVFKKNGAKQIESVGQRFNPELHEAVEVVRAQKEQKEGEIIEEIQKGYLFNEKVIRPARVKIIKGTD